MKEIKKYKPNPNMIAKSRTVTKNPNKLWYLGWLDINKVGWALSRSNLVNNSYILLTLPNINFS